MAEKQVDNKIREESVFYKSSKDEVDLHGRVQVCAKMMDVCSGASLKANMSSFTNSLGGSSQGDLGSAMSISLNQIRLRVADSDLALYDCLQILIASLLSSSYLS